jgi:hypothetical protein
LVEEEGDDAAVGAEDVAEADDGSREGMDEAEELGEALGGAHEGVGGDGLVGGDQEEPGGLVVGGGFEEGVGAEDVVGDGGEGVLLEEGDVLVGGGVEDDLGAVGAEEVGKQRGVGNAAEDGDGGAAESTEVAVDLVEGGLGGVEEDEGCGCGRDGRGEGGADGAACSGDEEALAFKVGERGFGLGSCAEETMPGEGIGILRDGLRFWVGLERLGGHRIDLERWR